MKRYTEAEPELQRAIELAPRTPKPYLLMGSALQELHETDAAIRNYQTALQLQPGDPALLALLGNLNLEKGDLPQARKYYEQSLAANPNFATAAGNLAWVYLLQGDNLDVALSLAEKAKQLMPEADSITDTLAWVHYKKGSYISARMLLQDCVRKAPERATYRYHLGMVLLASGDRQKAKTELQTALKLNLSSDDAQQARQALAQLN
jgi:tetratricopeptide (TPR) repeat protein